MYPKIFGFVYVQDLYLILYFVSKSLLYLSLVIVLSTFSVCTFSYLIVNSQYLKHFCTVITAKSHGLKSKSSWDGFSTRCCIQIKLKVVCYINTY